MRKSLKRRMRVIRLCLTYVGGVIGAVTTIQNLVVYALRRVSTSLVRPESLGVGSSSLEYLS